MKHLLRRIRHNRILDHIQTPQAGAVLDVSCQDGGFLFELQKRCPKTVDIFGFDIDKKSIKEAKEKIPQGIFRCGTGEELPFGDDSFDLVVSSMTLHHLDRPHQLLGEVKRILKPGGVFYLADIVAYSKPFAWLLNKLECPEPYHFEKFYKHEEVLSLVGESGLIYEESYRFCVAPSWSGIMPVSVYLLCP